MKEAKRDISQKRRDKATGHARARAPHSVGMSQCPAGHAETAHGTQRAGQDRTRPLKGIASHPIPPARSKNTWAHIGARELIARHEAGEVIDPAKLAVARSLLS